MKKHHHQPPSLAVKKPKRKGLHFQRLEDRILYSATPAATVDAPAEIKIGETATVTVTFDNTDPAQAGYGPWMDIFIDTTGADGIADPAAPANPQTGNTDGLLTPGDQYDGFTLAANPTYLGSAVTKTILTLDDTANAGKGVEHPYAVDATGAKLFVSTTDVTSQYYSTLNGNYTSGDQLMVLQLPFGSFTPDQPQAEISFGLKLSDHADANSTLKVTALAGFQYGNDPLNNPKTDPSIVGVPDVAISSVGVNLATLTKTYNGPENETATGANYVRTYRINVNVADGQTLTDLHLFDDLTDQIQFKQISGASQAYTVDSTPSTTVPGGKLEIHFDAPVIGGTGAADAWVDIEFYVPRVYDSDHSGMIDGADASVLNPGSGADLLVDNQAYGYGSWAPIDPRDATAIVGFNVAAGFDPTDATTAHTTAAHDVPAEHVGLEVSPLVVQKDFTTVTNVGHAGHSPGDVLQYTLNFQVSDYFAFENLVIDDVMLDGLRFDSSFVPTLEINGNTFTLGAAGWTSANFIVSQNFTGAVASDNRTIDPAVNDGSTALHFDISQEMITRGQNGKLIGGGIDPTAPTGTIANDLTGYNDGATTGKITYRATILDTFTDTYPSGEPAVNARDVLSNSVNITGDVLDLATGVALTAYAGPVTSTDNSSESLTIASEAVHKTIYAVNGNTDLSIFRDTNGNINLQAGDVVTYRFTYAIPSGDIENLRFTDFLPLPVFDVDDINADHTLGGIGEWSFVDNTANVAVSDFTAGHITYGPTHTLNTVSNPASATPTVTIDSIANSVKMQWGDFVNTGNDAKVVDILISATVNNAPFADGLFLTNQVQSGEGNTQSPGTESLANAIIQIVLNQPDVAIYKGVVASTQGGSVGTVGGLTFDTVGGAGFTGTLSGTANATAIGALNLNALTTVDNGDLVRFAIVAQNTGRSDAFDVRLQDTLQGSYINNYADKAAFMAATNFKVLRGDGTLLTDGVDYNLTWTLGTKTFQVELVDAYAAGNTAGDINTGGISRGFAPSTSSDIANGSNAVLVLYDLTVDTDAQASSTVTNTAKLTNYAGDEGAEDHTTENKSDSASIVIAPLNFTKALTTTSVIGTGNSATQAVIGEIVTYTITVTVPEGTSASAQIVDTMDDGLAFVGIVSTTYSSGVTSASTIGTGANPANVTIGNAGTGTGNLLTFTFGNITNTETDNGVGNEETITIVYQAVVLDTNTLPASPGNQAGSLLNNSADLTYTWTDDSLITDATVQAASDSSLGTGFAANKITGIALSGGNLIIDGVTLSLNNTVLVKDQATASQNGIYKVTSLTGTGELTRVASFDSSAEVVQKYTALVSSGTLSGGKVFSQQTDAVVLNTSPIAWAEGRMPTDSTPVTSSANNITIVEPVLTIVTENSKDNISYSDAVTGVDGGDFIYYRIRITNAAGTPTAFDLGLSDVIPATLDSLTVISTALTNAAGAAGGTISVTDGGGNTLDITDFAFTGNTLGVAGASNIDLGADSRLEIIVRGNLTGAVTPAQVIANTASVTWTSLDGSSGAVSVHNANSVERTGAGGVGTDAAVLNNYAASDATSLTTSTLVNTKSIVATSESFTASVAGTERVAIGEIVRYRLQIQIPEETLTDFQIVDALPTGMLFINDGSAMVGFISDDSSKITSSTLSGAGLYVGTTVAAPTFVLTDTAISTASGSNADGWDSGIAPRFKLGTVVNADNDADEEYIVIEFNAVVLNTFNVGNQSGTTLANSFSTQVNATTVVGNTSNVVNVIIAEPNITLAQIASTAGPLDAGDTFTYTVTVSNNASGDNAAPAFDVRIKDAIDAIVAANPTAELEYISYVLGALPAGTSLLTDASSTVTDTLDLTFNRLDAGQSFTITVTAQVKSGALAGAQIESKAVATYTSLPGASGTVDGTIATAYGTTDVDLNPGTDSTLALAIAGTTVPDAANTAERTGADSEATATNNTPPSDNAVRNNYAVAASAPALLIAAPTLDKTFKDGSISADDTTDALTLLANAAIGEAITYDILVTLPEGVTTNLRIRDILPAGLRMDSMQILTTAASTSLLAADFNGSFATTPTLAAPTSGASTVTFDFDNVTVVNDNVSNNNKFVIRVVATVENIVGNQATNTRTNTATLVFNDPDGAANAGPAADRTITDANVGNNPMITIVEPKVQVTLAVTSATTGIDAGDSVTYSVTINNLVANGASAPAYGVSLSDVLPAGMLISSISAPTLSGSAVVDTALAGTGTNTLTGIFDIPLGGEVTFTFTAEIPNSVTPGQSMNSDINVFFTSLSGSTADERTGGDVAEPESNTLADGSVTLNNFAVGADVNVTAINPFSVTKTLSTTSHGADASANVLIGEVVTFQLQVAVMEGTTSSLSIVDTLPTGLTYVPGSATISNANGITVNGFSANLVGQVLTLTATSAANPGGSNANSNDASVSESDSFFITYQTTVANVLSNQAGVSLTNDADATATGVAADNNNQVTVTIVEPTLTVAKSVVEGTPLDAGASLDYTITISNASGQTAYDVTLSDPIHASLDVLTGFLGTVANSSVVASAGAVVSANAFEIVDLGGGNYTVRTAAGSNVDIPTGESVTLTFRATISAGVESGTSVTNRANVRWSSLDGADAGERDGGDIADPAPASINQALTTGVLDNYGLSSVVVSTAINHINAVKSIETTSVGGSDGLATPGEVVTYKIVVTLPEGVSPDLQIRDAIPAGMAFIDGSLVLDSTGFVGSVSAPSSAPQSGVVFGNGTDIVFDFASITVTGDNNPTNNAFSFTYQAVVLDVVSNDGVLPGQTTITNAATHNDGGSDATFSRSAGGASLTVVEPDLNVTNTLSITGTKDAGAPFTYTITVNATANATSNAYGLSVSDILPTEFGSLVLSSASVSDGAITTDVSGNFSLVGNTLSTVTPVDLLLNTNGASDQVLTLTFSGNLTSSVNPGETVSTSTSIAYTNYTGDRTAAGGFNPNADVTTDHERAYTDSDTESFTAPIASFAKSLFATSETFTTGSNIAIGETVTYALLVTLPEGTTPDLAIVDRLPAGLQYISSSVVTTAAASGGLLTADFVGTVPAPTVGGGASNGDDVSFTFGAISVTGDNAATTNSFVIFITARALNVTGNQDAVTPQNDATMDITGDGQAVSTTPTVGITIVEPRVTVTQSVVGTVTGTDAGDTITYSVTINNLVANGATTDAFDVSLSDVLPVGMLINSIGVPSLSGSAVVDTALAGSGTNTLTGIFDIPLGGSVTFTFTAVVPDTVTPGQTLNGDINIFFTSLNGASANERDGSGVANPESNTLADGSVTLNNYAVGADTNVTVINPFSVTKTILTTSVDADASANVVIGEVVTFQLQVAVMEGTTSSISIVDTLPTGLTYVPGSAVISNANGITVNGFSANLVGQVLTLTATSAANPGGSNASTNDASVSESDSFFITYQTTVANILGNQNGVTRTNDADATATGVTADNNNQVTVTVVEPRVTIDKTATPTSGLDAGDTITYTVVLNNLVANGATSTAFDVLLTDAVPSGLLITGITSTTLNGGASVDTAVNITGGGTGLTGQYDIPVGGSVTIVYTATIQDTIIPGQSLVNNADATFTSLNGAYAGERTGGGVADPTDNTAPDDGTTLNNYAVGDSLTATALSYAPLVSKGIVSTSEAGSTGTNVLVGEVIRYRLKFELFEGTLNDLVIKDILPTGLQFLNDGTETFSTVGASSAVTGASLVARDSATGAGTTFGDGTDIFFQLGNVVNHDNDAGVEYGVIEFNAIVLNTVANQNAVTRDNNFAVLYDADNDAGTAPTAISTLKVDANDDGTAESTAQSVSNTVTVTVKEAALSFSETIPAGVGYDAGDPFSITYTITNSGSVPAYNVRLNDTVLPAEFDVTAISFDVTGTGGTVTDSTNLLTDSIDAELSQIAAGATWTVTATVSLRDTVNPADVYTNPAALTFTSLPGAYGTTGNATGSDTPGAAGAATGERTGADGVAGALNDYALASTASLSIPTPFSVAKAANTATATIGEVVTYTVTVTVLEGTTTNIVLNDTLPAGMTFVANSAVVTNAAGMTITGFAANSLDQTLTSVVNPGSADAIGTATSGTFTYTYQAVVLDVLGNDGISPAGDGTGQTTLVNDLDASADSVTDDNNNTATVTVVEPRLTLTKSNDDTDKVVSLGQVLTYTLTLDNLVANGSTATAYDIRVRDLIPASLVLTVGSINVTGATIASNSTAGNTLDLTLNSLALGSSATITFTATVGAGVGGNDVIDNNAKVFWDSLPADEGVAPETGNTVFGDADGATGDRDYGSTGPDEVHNVNTLNAQDTDRLTVGAFTFGDYVWMDTNADGVQDATEGGIGGVTLTLLYAGNDGVFGNVDDVTFATTTTGNDGSYSFNRLAAGNYRITTSTLPADAIQTYDADGTGTANRADFTVVAANITTADFGYRGTGSIGDIVWHDLDGSATQNGSEKGIGNVTLNLYRDSDNSGTVNAGDIQVGSTTTDVNGAYDFTGLLAGTYLVDVTDTNAILTSATLTGAAGVSDPEQVVLAASQDYNTADFGYQGAAALGDRVWNDRNSDGVQDAGEFGIAGLTVTLFRDLNHDGDALDAGEGQIATSVTGVNGAYSFTGLLAGDYIVQVTAPASSTSTYDKDDYSATVTNSISNISLTAAETDNTVDFGYVGSLTLGDRVWFDANADGVQDGSEPGVPNVRVFLDINGNGTYEAATETAVTTGVNGIYSIDNLVGGTYSVRVDTSTLPVGYVATSDRDGSLSADVTSVVLAASTNTVDFGYRGTNNITGRSYHDIDKNSTFDGTDTGLGGVTIELISDTDNDGVVDAGELTVLTATTAADGTYTFANVIAGDYIIRETQLGGYGNSQNATNLIDATMAAVSVTGQNFGNTTGSLAGRVFQDDDDSGAQNGAEPGIAGVTMTLTWSGADGIFGNGDDRTTTATTDALGDYLFDASNTAGFVANGNSTRGLLSTGIYTITEAQPATHLDGAETAGNATTASGAVTAGTESAAWLLANPGEAVGRGADSITGIQIGTAQVASGYNFGEILPASIAGAVHVDSNNNAIREIGETGIADNQIQLTGNDKYGRAVSITATTDINGDFTFSNLYESDAAGYTLRQPLQPSGYYDALEGAGSAGGAVNIEFINAIPLAQGVSASSYTFGEIPIPPVIIIPPTITPEIIPIVEKPAARITSKPTVLSTYFYDVFENFLGDSETEDEKTEEEDDFLVYLLNPPEEELEPMLTLMPMYSGHAEPGSTVVVEIKNIHGAVIGTETIVADAGGNWLAKFPSNIIFDTPTNVTQTVTRASYADAPDEDLNFRTYFSPATNPSHFFSEPFDIQKVFSENAPSQLPEMDRSYRNSEDWNGENYEFLTASGIPSS